MDAAVQVDAAVRDASRDASTASDAERTADTGSTPDANAALDTGADVGASPHAGFVQVEQQLVTGFSGRGTVTGAFGAFPIAELDRVFLRACTHREVGSCVAISCSGGSVPPLVSAGPVTVEVEGSPPLVVTHDASRIYSGMAPLLTAGTQITATATGDVVPTFALGVVTPAIPAATLPTTVSTASDLIVTWDAAVAATRARLRLSPNGPVTGRAFVRCDVPASSGTITVDASLLADLGAGSAIVGIAGITSSSGTAGEHDVLLRAILGTAVIATITD